MWGPETIENLPKIRQGNDFTFTWTIQRDGQPERLADASSLRLTLRGQHGETPIEGYRINENVISIDFTPEMLPSGGRYNIELKYNIADSSFLDGMRECTVDVDAFVVVLSTADADVRDLSATADVVVEEKEKMINTDLIPEASTTEKGLMTPAQYNKLNGLRESNLLAEYVHSGNREVRIERIDYETNTFYSPNHGLVEGDRLVTNFAGVVNIGQVCPLTASANKIHGYTAIGVTADTFKVAINNVVVKVQLKDTIDLSKWWFECSDAPTHIKINIPHATRDITVRYLGYGCGIYYYHAINGLSMYERGIVYSNNSVSWYQSHSLPYTPTTLIDSSIRITLGAFHVEQEVCNNFALKQDVGMYSVKAERITYRPMTGKTDGITSLLLASPTTTGAFIANGTTIRIYKND